MQEKEFETKITKPVTKPHPIIFRSPTLEQLLAMTTDQLVRMLLSPEMARSENAFMQSLLGGKTAGGK